MNLSEKTHAPRPEESLSFYAQFNRKQNKTERERYAILASDLLLGGPNIKKGA